jgi:hypothetical protein
MYTGQSVVTYSVDYQLPELETIHSTSFLKCAISATQQLASACLLKMESELQWPSALKKHPSFT